jgi:hypothetical protein
VKRKWIALGSGVAASGIASAANAFVPVPVGGHPGELDVNFVFQTDRGKYEPTENPLSYRPVEGWYEYRLSVGYTWGHFGFLQFFSTRLEGNFYTVDNETNDPGVWYVAPSGTVGPNGKLVPECGAGAKFLGDGLCEFYSPDTGGMISGTISAALVHTPQVAFGLFVKGTVPIGMNLRKFVSPRMDYLAGGFQLGAVMTSWLDFEVFTYFGSGTHPISSKKNSSAIGSTLFHFHAKRWALPWKAGIKFGPYVEGDMTQRDEPRYDLAYAPQQLPAFPSEYDDTPVRQNDRLRSAKYSLAFLPYFLVTEHVAVELGYIQKFFGYDPPATQAWFAGVRGLINIED